METTRRIDWIDALRFLGIFTIYLGHLGNQAGYFYPLVFRYHVPLFFFISGAMEVFTKPDTTFVQYLSKKFTAIVLPYFFFGLISIVLIFLAGNATAARVLQTAIQYLLGIRNQLFAPALWFLPCLFVVSILFFMLKKLFSNRWLLLIGAGLLAISETLLPNRPLLQPSWFWNIDSALYYFFYFALGYAAFPFIGKLLSSDSRHARWGLMVFASIAALYAGSLLLGKDFITIALQKVPGGSIIGQVLCALCLILLNIFLAQLISTIELLQRLGRDTLFLCGSEQIIRHFTAPFFSLVGWNFVITSPLSAIMFTFVVLLVAKFGIIPFLKTFYYALLKQIGPITLSANDQRPS